MINQNFISWVESTDNIRIKMTCHKVIGDRRIWEGILRMNPWMPAVSVSQSCQSVLMCVKVEWRNNVSLRKGKNCAILQVKDLIKNIVKFNVEKMLCALTSCAKHLFEAHKIINVHRNKLKVYISLKGNKLICFAN